MEDLFLHVLNESPLSRRIRYAKYWLRKKAPDTVRVAIRRLKLSEVNLIPIPIPIPIPRFRILSQREYHEQYCDLSNFTGYCPKTGRYWSLPVNYCPLCSLSLARVRGYKLLRDQVVFINQSQRMTGPIPRFIVQSELAQTPPRDHIFPYP
jgi:hypothetical protein